MTDLSPFWLAGEPRELALPEGGFMMLWPAPRGTGPTIPP